MSPEKIDELIEAFNEASGLDKPFAEYVLRKGLFVRGVQPWKQPWFHLLENAQNAARFGQAAFDHHGKSRFAGPIHALEEGKELLVRFTNLINDGKL